ncbi:MAG: cytochrome c [Phycisphaerae bacterium]|nr:cytochrome c [Phycisphaerae bacterium]NUQ45180.1 cytochrome c [Phycisphaerae bacterium]
MFKRYATACIVLAGLGIVQGCVDARARQQREAKLADTGRPALHTIHNDRLHELMEELNRRRFARMPQELDAGIDRRTAARNIARSAAALAETAGYIPESLADSDLSEEERAVFIRLAHKLHEQSLALQRRAEAMELDSVPNELEAITATCNACHSAFRQVAGESVGR